MRLYYFLLSEIFPLSDMPAYSAAGDLLWDKTYGGVFEERVSSIQQTSGGRYVVAGSTYHYAYDFLILKATIKLDDSLENPVAEDLHFILNTCIM